MSPDDARHGTNAGYNAGCRSECCRVAHRLEQARRRRRPRPMIPSTGTHRRIQALHRLGWSATEISRRAGRSQFWAQQILRQGRVYQGTAATIQAIYDELSMTWNTAAYAARTAAEARAKGWPPPLAWDDDEIDDPNAVPYAVHVPIAVDEVVVERVLAGDWRLPTTKAEKVEVTRRWHAAGRSLGELSRITGWKPDRYFKVSGTEAGEAA